MKITIKKINTEIVPQLNQLDNADREIKKAKEAFFAQTLKVYEDERFKQLNAQLEARKKALDELELKQQLRENIAKLQDAITNLDFDFQPVKTSADMPASLAGIFERQEMETKVNDKYLKRVKK